MPDPTLPTATAVALPASRLAPVLATRLRENRTALATRWLERILDRVALPPERIFPSEELLDHIPRILEGIADHVESPATPAAADASLLAHAMELGALRFEQGFSADELLKEYEILTGILFADLHNAVMAADGDYTPDEALVCAHRLNQALALIQQATTSRYMQQLASQVREREERLRAFTRTLTHEFRNRIGAALGAAQLMELFDLRQEEQRRMADVVVRNVDSMRVVLDNLLELSRLGADTRRQRNVMLRDAVGEAARQLRDQARACRVEIRIADPLPEVEVPAAALELCLVNLLSNAIKYADPDAPVRWARVEARMVEGDDGRPSAVEIRVADNGAGVPAEHRASLFERFHRAHADQPSSMSAIEGTGLGLSIVRETIERLGGRVRVEFGDPGTTFALVLPSRRAADAGRAAPEGPGPDQPA